MDFTPAQTIPETSPGTYVAIASAGSALCVAFWAVLAVMRADIRAAKLTSDTRIDEAKKAADRELACLEKRIERLENGPAK